MRTSIPAVGTGLGYDDLKIIEAYEFLKSIAAGQLSEPSFSEALAVANVQAAVARSWETRTWERIQTVPPELETHGDREGLEGEPKPCSRDSSRVSDPSPVRSLNQQRGTAHPLASPRWGEGGRSRGLQSHKSRDDKTIDPGFG